MAYLNLKKLVDMGEEVTPIRHHVNFRFIVKYIDYICPGSTIEPCYTVQYQYYAEAGYWTGTGCPPDFVIGENLCTDGMYEVGLDSFEDQSKAMLVFALVNDALVL